MSEEVLDQAAKDFRDMLDRRFNQPPREGFTLSLSKVGKPTCQLQMEKSEAEREEKPYSFHMQMLIGDMIEVAGIAILKAAGVAVHNEQQSVELRVAGESIRGRKDLDIYENGKSKTWDIKSASPFAFENKFSRGFPAVKESDTFGYVEQGYGYDHAGSTPFGGWIVINKSTGEWCVTETPENDWETKKEALTEIFNTVKTIRDDKPFERCFDDEPETYYKKETGNRVLGKACSFCDFKWSCWPTLQQLPDQNSTAKNRKLKYYTYVKEQESDEDSATGTD
jgi:hypothetical protein